MCFSKMPDVPKPIAPPTVRDAVTAGVQKRQNATGGITDTTATGGLGDTSKADTYKPKLGA